MAIPRTAQGSESKQSARAQLIVDLPPRLVVLLSISGGSSIEVAGTSTYAWISNRRIPPARAKDLTFHASVLLFGLKRATIFGSLLARLAGKCASESAEDIEIQTGLCPMLSIRHAPHSCDAKHLRSRSP